MRAGESAATAVATDEILVGQRGRLGRITLNRPKAINALTLTMVRAIDAQLSTWESDDTVGSIVIDGAGDRGLCAGGDITALYRAATESRTAAEVRPGEFGPVPEFAATFWREEYRLNERISRFPKPIIAVMSGLVMGGGVGISAHASIRLATETAAIGTPEVGIGFAPDVGASYLLPRAPGELGTHVALSTIRLGPADALLCGLADHFVPSERLPELISQLAAGDAGEVLASYRPPSVPAGQLDEQRGWIDACYGADSVTEILSRLRARPEPAAVKAAERIERNSPTALAVALRSMRLGASSPSLGACLDHEYRISCRFAAGAEFVEGIRAAVIDKDRRPQWNPGTLAEVTDEWVDEFFATLGADELGLGQLSERKGAS